MTRTMTPTQWPGLGPSVDFSSLDGGGNSRSTFGPGNDPYTPASTPDGVARPWWTCGTSAGNSATGSLGGTDPFGSSSSGSNSITGMLNSIMNALQQFASTLTQSGGLGASSSTTQQPWSPGGSQPWSTGGQQQPWSSGSQQPWSQGTQQSWVPGGPEQSFSNLDVGSSGDPHLAEVGTTESGQSVNAHWDSMSSHGDLVHSDQIAGGYRVSTAVTAPGSGGVTYNQSATVHTNYGQDSVTMNRDGSFSIDNAGQSVTLAKGQSTTLSGGATVSANQDGSLTVTATNAQGGSIATTMRCSGQGVDVDSHAREIALGGDAIAHGQKPYQPVQGYEG
jgi:hypothetical protein